MSQSEKLAAEEFTLRHYIGNCKNEKPQKTLIGCLKFGTDAHKDQKRKDIEQTPYINHPIGVAQIVAEEAGVTNLDLIQGCLLHDTVEDTAVVTEVIRAKFGDYIGNLVQEVTDDKTLPKQKRKDLQVIHAKTSSPQAKMVKMADKLYNLRDLERSLPIGWTEQRRKEYYEWAFQVCKGLRGVNMKLDEKLDEFFKKRGLISERGPNEQPLEIPQWPNYDELKPILAAANFAAEKHSRHFTLDATNSVPLINHVVSVAFIITQEADIQDITILCAALLHDVVRKSDTTITEIVEKFGKEVAQLVEELTYCYNCTFNGQFNSQINKAGSLSHNAKVIALASMIDNCRQLEVFEPEGWTPELRINYFKWALNLCSLMAGTNTQLEQELAYIWIGQGLREMPMQSKKES